MQLSMPKTSNNIGNKIYRLTRHRDGIYNIRSTFPCSTRLLIFMAAGFRSTCIVASFSSPGTIQLSRASANTPLDLFVNPRCLLRSFRNLSVDVVNHTTWRLSYIECTLYILKEHHRGIYSSLSLRIAMIQDDDRIQSESMSYLYYRKWRRYSARQQCILVECGPLTHKRYSQNCK